MHISAPRFVSALHFFKHTVNLTCKKRSTCSAIRKDTSERSERGVNRGDTSQVQDCVEVILTSVYPRGYQGGKVENKFPGEGIRGSKTSFPHLPEGKTWAEHRTGCRCATSALIPALGERRDAASCLRLKKPFGDVSANASCKDLLHLVALAARCGLGAPARSIGIPAGVPHKLRRNPIAIKNGLCFFPKEVIGPRLDVLLSNLTKNAVRHHVGVVVDSFDFHAYESPHPP